MNELAFPSKEELTSGDPKVADESWERAYRILWAKGMAIAVQKMRGVNHQDRENVVSQSIQQFSLRLFENEQRERESI